MPTPTLPKIYYTFDHNRTQGKGQGDRLTKVEKESVSDVIKESKKRDRWRERERERERERQ